MLRLKAVVPEAEMYKYATQLHSITHGRATYRATFKSRSDVLVIDQSSEFFKYMKQPSR